MRNAFGRITGSAGSLQEVEHLILEQALAFIQHQVAAGVPPQVQERHEKVGHARGDRLPRK